MTLLALIGAPAFTGLDLLLIIACVACLAYGWPALPTLFSSDDEYDEPEPDLDETLYHQLCDTVVDHLWDGGR